MRIAIASICASFVLLSACATDRSAEGKRHRIDCSGTALNWDTCKQRAAKICGKGGYDVLKRYGDPAYIYTGRAVARTMLVQCKDAETK